MFVAGRNQLANKGVAQFPGRFRLGEPVQTHGLASNYFGRLLRLNGGTGFAMSFSMMDAMRKLLLGTTLTLAIAFVSPASAMPAGYPLLRDAAVSIDLIEVGGAKVGGTSTVIARLVGAAPARWAGGYGCPPGHWKKG